MLARRAGVLFDRLFRQGTIAGLGESDLLARFVSERDEAAFAALVDRHGPMVLGVCRRLLRDDRDAEDAFQATFLVLARRAGAIRDGDRLGGWLHGVARKVASRAKARRIRRWLLETNVVNPDVLPSKHPASDPDDWKGILDDELARLPETQRIPLVLCYLEGMTHDEAALRLGWPVGTVRSRMARGRDRLRGRLSQRGIDAETPMPLAPAVSQRLLEVTVSSALNYTTPSILSGTATSAAVLANGSLQAMMLSKSTTFALAGVAAAAALIGGPLLARQIQGESGSASVRKSIDKLQADLVETARRNAEMQQELLILRHELESFRGAGGVPAEAGGMPGGMGMMSGPAATMGGRAEPSGMMPGMGGMGPGGMGSGGGAPPMAGESGGKGGMPGMAGMAGGYGMMMGGRGEGGAMPGMMGMGGGMLGGGMGGPGGMSAMMGGIGDKAPRHYRVFNHWLLVISPSGDRATMYEPNTGRTRPIQLGEENQAPIQVQPVVAAGLLVLNQNGPGIIRTAVFVESEATWYPSDLKAPVESTSPTIVDGKTALIETADHLYLWNGDAKRWDPQALPRGTSRPGFAPGSSISTVAYETEGHIYKYDFEKGKWVDIDTRQLLSRGENEGERPARDAEPK